MAESRSTKDENPTSTTTNDHEYYLTMTSEELIEFHGTKSAAIRALGGEGLPVGEIAKRVGVIYQHARNVLVRPLKRGPRNKPKVITPVILNGPKHE